MSTFLSHQMIHFVFFVTGALVIWYIKRNFS